MVGKFYSIFTYHYSTPLILGSDFGLEVVAALFPVSFLKLEKTKQKLLQMIVYICPQLSSGYLKD